MASFQFHARKPTGDDLTVHDTGDTSPPEDFITLFVKARFTSQSQLTLSFESPTAFNDRANYTCFAQNKRQPSSTLGLASLLEVENSQVDILGRDRFASLNDQDVLSENITEKNWVIPTDGWQYLAVPKRLFKVLNNFTFANVNGFFLHFINVDQDEVCFSDVFLVGGGVDHAGAPSMAQGTDATASSGLQGTYKYRLTYLNEDTGNRSNPSPATQVAENVNRGSVTLANIPTSLDAQVTHVEIWRTMGGGSDFFKIAEIANGTATFVDEVADHDSLDQRDGVAVMTDEALQFDNATPEDHFDQHVIVGLRAYWISNEAGWQGRVMFSPVGRPESFSDFVEVSKAGDPLHRLVVYNGIVYVVSESKMYRIDEDSEGFIIPKEMAGVPGVKFAQRRTVMATPKGIMWNATDGIRVFNGSQCILVNPDPIEKVFRGEAAENLAAFEGTVAAFARGEYQVSDNSQLLAVSVEDGSWREVGFTDVTALFYEWDTDKIVAGRTSNTQLVEEEGDFTDDASDIAIEWETAAIDGPNNRVVIVERTFIDADVAGETVTPTLVHRLGSTALTNMTTSGRTTYENEVNLMVLKPSIRLTGNVGARVEVYDIELEVRDLELGINVTTSGERETIPGRYRESASDELVFQVQPVFQGLNQQGSLVWVERAVIEMNSGGNTVALEYVDGLGNTISVGSTSTTVREYKEFSIEAPAPIRDFILDVGTLSTVQIYGIEVYVRPVILTVQNRTGDRPGDLVKVDGKMIEQDQAVVFDMDPYRNTTDGELFIPLIESLSIDIDSGGATIAPKIVTELGTIFLDEISTNSRSTEVFDINQVGNILRVELDGDFTSGVALYDLQLNMRSLDLSINIVEDVG